MILSHSHRFIAFKTRKTAGTSFEIALSKYLSAQDVVTPIAAADEAVRSSLGYRGPQNYQVAPAAGMVPGARPIKLHNHIGAAQFRRMVPPAIFDDYVKVSIVRNPFDYAVSWYYWERTRRFPTSREDFCKWLKANYDLRAELETLYLHGLRTNPGVFSSNRLITHIDGACVIDVMLRYEQLQEDVALFAAKVGLPAALGPELGQIRTKGSYRPATATARDMFEGFGEGQEMIRTTFAEEIERYGYGLA